MIKLSDSFPKVFNISLNASFLDTIVEWTIEKYANDPLVFSSITILLPSRRACREIKKIFLQKSRNQALLLPKIKAIGDVDYDELRLNIISGGNLEELNQIVTPSAPLKYRLLLIKEIMEAQELGTYSLETASNMAIELESFLDEVNRENLSLENLGKLSNNMTDDLSEHWQQSLDFLMKFDKRWRETLENEGIVSLSEYRNNMLLANAEFLKNNPPKYPVIAVASADNIPAASELLNTIVHLKNGHVFLRGMDRIMDEKCWKEVNEFHSQFTIKKLLEKFDCTREQVQEVVASRSSLELPKELEKAVYYTTLPAVMTDKWSELRQQKDGELSQSFDNVKIVEARNTREEAAIISLMMRETLDHPEKTVALITNDRDLASMVRVNMQKWDLRMDDSVGIPLSQTKTANYLRIIAENVEKNFPPVKFLALLKHLFTHAGMESELYQNMLNEFEAKVLRGVRASEGLEWMYQKIDELGKLGRLKNADKLHGWLSNIENILRPLVSLMEREHCELNDVIKTHINCAENLASNENTNGKDLLWNSQNASLGTGSGGEEVYNFFLELQMQGSVLGRIETLQYSKLLNSLMSGRVYRESENFHPRLHILSPMETRLLNYDLVIISGLNEGNFPQMPKISPWMSRAMSEEFGFSKTEKSLGVATYDFVANLFNKEVVLTRSLKEKNAPTTKSRFLLRLEAVANNLGIKFATVDRYRELVKLQDLPEAYDFLKRPSPKPELQYRPRKLSATKIEKLIFDPYTIYALEILGLKKMDDLEKDFSPAEFGNFVHKALEDFARDYNNISKNERLNTLLNVYGERAYQEIFAGNENSKIIYWSKFELIAKWFIKEEETLRNNGYQVFVEKTGKLEIEVDNGNTFTITAKADRIQFNKEGKAEIVDYKTGVAPEHSKLKSGERPQLPIEALIVNEGGFAKENEDMANFGGAVGALEYWKISGNDREQYGCEKKKASSSYNNDYTEQLTSEALVGLRKLIEWFANEDSAYTPRAVVDERETKKMDYEHLSRRKEWLYN